ncbi:MAG: HD domain-containing protein [Clostridia bacterium]|nr:HD domain-containing protein [Clostridia bacterium]
MLKEYIEYETTCFIDKDWDLSGILEINENTYIDFNRRTIYVNSVDQKIPATKMALLEKLILESPNVVTYEILFHTYYGTKYFDVEVPNIQALRNSISFINGFVPITNVPKTGYKIELPKRIKRFGNIRKCEVTDISELFPVSKEEISSEKIEEMINLTEITLGFSKKFFHSGAVELAKKDGKSLINELKKLSGVFNSITTLNGASSRENVIGEAYELITESCRNKSIKEILKIKGPLGSYKNRIMQYLYLAIAKNNSNILPFYIDLAFYEKMAESDPNISDDDIIRAFLKDFEEIKALKEEYITKTPLLMIDGVRDFSRGYEALYYFISKKTKELNCKLVVCMDGDFTVNKQHMFNVHPLASDKHKYYMRITSMNLYKRSESIEFIKNCIELSEVEIPEEATPERIYESLVKLSFISIDAYWLVYLIKYYHDNLLNPRGNISDLYSAICMSDLGSSQKIASAAELAYKFEFDSVDFYNNPFFDERWQLIRKHRSVLDFLIAKHYVRKISGLDFSKSYEENVKSLSFFNMVLQKNITRFVVDMLGGNDDYEHKIMIIAEKYYDSLSLFGKSELTFWMVRLHNPSRRKKSIQLLTDYIKKEIQRYNDTSFKTSAEEKNTAFLIRGICVSLIYEKDETAFRYYIKSLIDDKIANTVNRGFHLEYYGDKPYIPNKTLLDFEDDVTKGENTLNVLCLSLDKRYQEEDTSSLVAVLEVMTLCNLIQARVERAGMKDVLDVRPYMNKCLRYLDWIIENKSLRKFREAAEYFMWMKTEYERLLSECPTGRITYSAATPFNKFSKANEVIRTGWVRAQIPEPENIVEHMYNCWLMGVLYLPETYGAAGYNKNRILHMLLLHDLGETETGDICRPDKEKKQKFYDYQENTVMQSLLLSGTYPDSADINKYLECWNDWAAKNSINYSVAKDIDNIQTIYRFCAYHVQYPDKFDTETIVYWLSGLNELETEIGKGISAKLIKNNPEFAYIIKQAGDIFND